MDIPTKTQIHSHYQKKYLHKSSAAFIGLFHSGMSWKSAWSNKVRRRKRTCKVGTPYKRYDCNELLMRSSVEEPYDRLTDRASLETPQSFRDNSSDVKSKLLEGADEELDRKYWHWRIRIFYSIFIGYAFYYFTRNSFTYVAPAMRVALGFNLQQLGVITSIFPLAYGFSKLASGILSDRFSTRLFMSTGLAITGVVNILFGLSSNLYILCLLWALNGVFQGFGAPPCARLLTQWYSRNERGTWWGFWNTSHNTGGFLIPLVAGYFATKYGWNYGMIVPGILGLAMSCFLFNRLRDKPESVGLPPVHIYRDDSESDHSSSAEDKHERLSFLASLRIYVFSNPYVWLLALSYFFIYFIRQGISSWAHVFLLDFKGVTSPQEAAFRVSGMEIGGLMGSLVSGWASDRMLRGRRIPIIILWLVGVLVSIISLWYIPGSFRYITWLVIFSIGFFIYGPQMLVGLAGAEIVHKDAVSTTIGFLGWVAYLGASFAGFPLTTLIARYGWQAYLSSLMG
ncbi:MFS transporter, sugar-phosphate transporter [Galdieria sulphuraria]|uniref:MFS transporter, sugar-phosphate transporter n=1 Tax=Galdieria sulphuraria TaxID=130081 RepID=M2W1F3_GALSU|nr:MFS transporter, sugar-phosphate transporter [Galdieria sulphuraria]EME29491.1 MFS transporter, sugar-phosphate transporter [Galdieria sulphuraria]|eukprot:XP_005706011.1 MFS transporter, sugar-phosphate transporter [Galdieria sulphuraria]